jgi:acyl-CoA thioesterase II
MPRSVCRVNLLKGSAPVTKGLPMSRALEHLLSVLDLEQLEVNLFRGLSPQVGWQRVFGGQVIGQALVAAHRTVNGRPAHSLHAYFLRPGDPTVPIIYEVDRIRDGGSFSTRRVVAIQHGQAIFSMAASFHKDEPGLHHQMKMPDVPSPESLPSEAELKEQLINRLPEPVKAYWQRERPIEIRPVDLSRYLSPENRAPTQQVWIRATGSLGDDLALHQCVLAYASDFTLLDTALIAHGRFVFDPGLMLASLDHAIWFHRSFRADDWLLYAQDSPSSGAGRAFCRGTLFTREGDLVASTAQEGLVRERQPKLPPNS